MPVTIPSTTDILTYIENFIKAKNPTIDTQVGTDLYDLIFHGNAQAVSRTFEEIDNIEDLQSIFTTVGDDLDLVARNYNLTRKKPVAATGFATLFTTSFSSDTIIPDNTIVSTRGTVNVSGISFRTIGSQTLLYNDRVFFFNADKGRYEITVPIQSTLTGIDGNQGVNQISVVQSNVSQIEGCINYSPTTGGRDSETDKELQQRCALSWVVSTVGTIDGYKKIIIDRDEATDAFAIGPFDTDSVRQGVDVYTITTSALTPSIQPVTYNNDIYSILTNQPAVEVLSVINQSLAPVYNLVENVSYTFNKQINNSFSGSSISDSTTARIDWEAPWTGTVNSVTTQYTTFTIPNSGSPANVSVTTADAYKNTRITFLTGNNVGLTRTVTSSSYDADNNLAIFTTNAFPNTISADDILQVDPRPNISDTIEINYLYNPDISVLQSFIDQSTLNVVGANTIIKTGFRGQLYLVVSIVIFPQYDTSTVVTKVENALNQYLSVLKLGDSVQLSDLIVVAQTGQGTDFTIVEVDYVDINTDVSQSYIVRWDGTIEGFSSEGLISVENREHVVLGNLIVS